MLDEGSRIAATLEALAPLRRRGVEIIVVDGGSADETVAQARPWSDLVITAPRGRASQMNAGAERAKGDVLLFLHADARLPENADRIVLSALAGEGRDWGRFDVELTGRAFMLRVVAFMMNWRSRLTGVATGDQAIFMRRDAFLRAGRYPDIPLMEDIAISKALKRLGPPVGVDGTRDRVGAPVRGQGRLAPHPPHVVLASRLLGGRRYGEAGAALWLCPATATERQRERRRESLGIAVFARAPVAGEAKTRLIPRLGAQGAAALHAALVRKVLSSAVEARLGEVTLWCSPDTSHPFFADCRAEFDIGLAPQSPGDIGQRMLAAFAARRGPLSARRLGLSDAFAGAFSSLRRRASGRPRCRVPPGGGWWLWAHRVAASDRRALFVGIEWGTERVMQQTRARLHAAALTWSEPATVWDVDRPEDVARLLEHDPQEWTPFFRSPAARDGGLPPPKAG